MDLPIDVAEDERRLHNDARRFARLLVSEIKLYNEKKVQEGRQANDLYERLREAIDRSREMYDKRVQPPVASKFDYFHYELVNALADGNAERLGSNYPGSAGATPGESCRTEREKHRRVPGPGCSTSAHARSPGVARARACPRT